MKKIITLFACALLWVAVLPVQAQTKAPNKEVKLFFEKIYLHTDRQYYAPGDDIWYKAYLLNAQDNRPLNTTKSLYVELIAPTGKVMSREIILLSEGLGKGDFTIPDTIATGNYRLRAYTNWMRNFGDNFIFEKQISIVRSKIPTVAANNTGTPVTRFFPEGGALVTGISTLVAVKTETANGKGVAAKGAILSSTGDTVASFATDTLGMGLFSLLPLNGQTYQAKTLYGAKLYSNSLPATLNNGLALKIYRKDTTLYAVITCNEQAQATYAAQTLTIKARSFGKVTYNQTLQLKGNTAAVIIPTSQLPSGIASITLYDGGLKPNCERLIYIDNPHKAKLNISLSKTTYAPREQINIDVKTADNLGKPVDASFSLTAVDAAMVPVEESDILAYLMLQSELKGEVRYAARYFDTTNVQRQKQLDLLLLTQGWRDFVWKRLADTSLTISYLPEQGISISGIVKDKKGAVPNANITLIAPKASNGRLFSAKTDVQGKYYFDNLLLYGQQSLRVNSKDVKGKALGIISIDSLSAKYPAIAKSAADYTHAVVNPALTAALVKQVTLSKRQGLSDTMIRLKDIQVTNVNKQVLRDQTITSLGYKDEVLVVKEEDKRYNTLRDYIQFASNQARVDADNDRLYFMADGKKITPRIIINNRDALFTDNDPIDVINTIANSYYDLPVTSVEKVVIKKMIGGPSLLATVPDSTNAPTDPASSAGVSTSSKSLGVVFLIYLTLKPSAFNKAAPGATQAEINGYYEARTFYKPLYNRPKPEIKLDARATLHWEADGSTRQNGNSHINYYNSDSKTTVRIVVQGITSTGVPLVGVKTYNIK
ncbi:MG2 domain-containing protein [Mucilaginibacter terrae]|uniref:carboxypeptidase-like regulatory domain-containing protein n=1 Tax=Mucilaginibacter terrae TaxID=1955052 RepID=UPI00362B5DFC